MLFCVEYYAGPVYLTFEQRNIDSLEDLSKFVKHLSGGNVTVIVDFPSPIVRRDDDGVDYEEYIVYDGFIKVIAGQARASVHEVLRTGVQ